MWRNLPEACAEKDSRIRYRKLEKNGGISGNTNACIDMATGDYIALFDHDDLLHPSALYEVMKAICEQDADYIYSDEATFHDGPEGRLRPTTSRTFRRTRCGATTISATLRCSAGNCWRRPGAASGTGLRGARTMT